MNTISKWPMVLKLLAGSVLAATAAHAQTYTLTELGVPGQIAWGGDDSQQQFTRLSLR
jgi:hypothetical protein